jgi:hypothetical protein
MPGSASNKEEPRLDREQLECLVEVYKIEYENLRNQLTRPPEGWHVFGSHTDLPWVELEFWGEEGGIPIWERPKLTMERGEAS